jgi:hypothetical protein
MRHTLPLQRPSWHFYIRSRETYIPAQFKANRYAYALRLLEFSGDPRVDTITAVPEHGERGTALTFVDHA